MRAMLMAVILIVILVLAFLLHAAFPNALANDQSRQQLFMLVGWLVLMASGVALRFRSRPGSGLRSLAAWLLAALVLVWVYAYRFEAQEIGQRMLAVIFPSHGRVVATTRTAEQPGNAAGEVRFAVNREGYYQIDARVNGAYVTFLVDTGASDIVLAPADALRIGLSESQLSFTDRVETANGVAYVAPVTLRNLVIGPITLSQLPAKVNKAPMQYSLLGMRFLNQLHGWRVERQVLILQP
ncbi:MAG TPA: TIGR02281 family clan AA aspartic protease [Dongiaceae bacterium]